MDVLGFLLYIKAIKVCFHWNYIVVFKIGHVIVILMMINRLRLFSFRYTFRIGLFILLVCRLMLNWWNIIDGGVTLHEFIAWKLWNPFTCYTRLFKQKVSPLNLCINLLSSIKATRSLLRHNCSSKLDLNNGDML